ncbi:MULTISPECIES: N-formylglutamate amidohydrolase [Sphingomonas]|uniref:N-formylglutamate amidohydrolase n=1 Tax=Sphingomonas TaxID=13687 RepID=UPI000DF0013A|nr:MULTISPECIES: N-formylglutamate amidohydrolase [Sphingomonas]
MTETTPLSPIVRPGTGRWPVLLSVPHAGTSYPPALLADSRHGRRALEALEDPLVDRLIWRAAALGIGAVIARAPRGLIDCNRGPLEMDARMIDAEPGHDPGPRARGGLGLVPTRTPRHGELWRRPLSRSELQRRKNSAWTPFHDALAEQLRLLHRRHGEVLLLDVHSMPARAAGLPRLVIGDRHGRSAAAWLGDLVRRTAEGARVSTAFNDPYAGGYVVERHGRPRTGVHALQLEFDRGCYLAADGRSPGAGFDRVARLLEQMARDAGEALLDRQASLEAAE